MPIMLTPDQQQWIDHLSDTETVRVLPYDERAPEIVERAHFYKNKKTTRSR